MLQFSLLHYIKLMSCSALFFTKKIKPFDLYPSPLSTYPLLALLLVLCSGCGDPANIDQGKAQDTGLIIDIGPEDLIDEGVLDAGILDESLLDEGPLDEGSLDEGPLDEGPLDEDPLDEGIPDQPNTPAPPRGLDEDQDGLEDYWEWSLNAPELFNWTLSDTDGDGVIDAEEDEDHDGLSALDEQTLSHLFTEYGEELQIYYGRLPHPLYRDLLVQIDEMEDQNLDPMALMMVVDAFSALEVFTDRLSGLNEQQSASVSVHLLIDQELTPIALEGDFETRFSLLRESIAFGESYASLSTSTLANRFVHLITARERTDDPSRAGEAVNHPDDLSSSGLIIYTDTIASQHPSCGIDSPPPVPFIERFEAQAGTIIHELGHALQLGHDTNLNGGVNPYNVMSVITGCVSTRQRYHGEGNQDSTLGSTEVEFAPRFSLGASELMRFDAKLSVDVSRLDMEGSGLDH